MSCKFCKHESPAYHPVPDEDGHTLNVRCAEQMPSDDPDVSLMISWPDPKRRYLGINPNTPCLVVELGPDEELCVPIYYCPICGRELPKSDEVAYWRVRS